ncbi:MerR family transcriptional regulator [Oceanirhabdus seepicola]|uniref:MerR family transcriptional regulator n=1 Tax=Oceanirhabdus seepicola TaxID=2828781 RepID=A0A9J6NYA2_9CLOT|nr:MerR family transcriptional regulator [Oceanirhabdus seepicola]MCM1989503.1 MerR family transcriptional regulator [Oceanirhabdus seepicola]
MTSYRTIDIAREVGIHVNTVRLYEQIGFISVAPRSANGYRIFSDKHLYQTKIARLIVHGKWPGKPIRNSGMKIVRAMKEWDLIGAHQYARDYVKAINEEQEKALVAIKTLENWGNNIYASSKVETYNRKQTAAIIGTSPEVLRNWERRGLIKVPQKSNKRVYSSLEIERLHVIYVMLQSNYKIVEISERLQLYDKEIINKIPNEVNQRRDEHISNMRSHWLEVSDNALENAMKVLDLLNEIFQTLHL